MFSSGIVSEIPGERLHRNMENMETKRTFNFVLEEGPKDVAYQISNQRNFHLDKVSHHLATLGPQLSQASRQCHDLPNLAIILTNLSN